MTNQIFESFHEAINNSELAIPVKNKYGRTSYAKFSDLKSSLAVALSNGNFDGGNVYNTYRPSDDYTTFKDLVESVLNDKLPDTTIIVILHNKPFVEVAGHRLETRNTTAVRYLAYYIALVFPNISSEWNHLDPDHGFTLFSK
ncbi:MAG: hypothetical protein IJH12_08045 [Clostridia bacterium]|nr:hypothetical protein [Clostridia bacterium]